MKVLTYAYEDQEKVGILTEDEKYVIPVSIYSDMEEL